MVIVNGQANDTVFLCNCRYIGSEFCQLEVLCNRARTGHGKLGKSLNFEKSFSRPGKSWIFLFGHGKY